MNLTGVEEEAGSVIPGMEEEPESVNLADVDEEFGSVNLPSSKTSQGH